ncbi:MAG: protein kinase domain-containing protein [Gemmatimonadales bacterium]
MTSAVRACPNCQTPLPEAAQFCMTCGRATPTDPGVPPRTEATGTFEVDKVTRALAGRYRVERVVGEGGMATVYLAQDLKHQREVAVKVMRPELAATLGADRFLREVQIAARLSHPHILPMHDSGEANGVLYYVMPYVEGETLKDRLAREGPLPPERALRLTQEIVEALAFAHSRGFIHRDIKPANILLQSGHALVADFGIARAVEDVGGESLTRTGLAVGTPQYMAPEQAAGEKEIDGRADVYAAGAILYELLTGETPFAGPNARAILTRSLTESPRAPSKVRPGLPPTVDAVVLTALARNADDRYATAEEFGAAIDGLRQGAPTPSGMVPAIAPPPTVTMPVVGPRRALASRRNALLAGLALLALAAVVFGVRRRNGGAVDAGGPPSGNRVAVMPFRGEGAPDDVVLVDGLLGDVRNRFSDLSALKVIGAASVNGYRNTTKSVADIGRELTADYLLNGTLRWVGSGAERRVLADVKLVDARSGGVRWSETVDMPDSALAGLPGEIARRAAPHLGVTPTAEEQAALTTRSTTKVDAYRSFLRGQQITLTGNADPVSSRAAVQEYEQAVALDATMLDAWARLSTAASNLYFNGNHDPVVAARAKEALDRVETLRPGSSLAHRLRAAYLQRVIGDEAAAASEIEQALRQTPNDVSLLQFAGTALVGRGDIGSALTILERARDLDPRERTTLNNLARAYSYLGRDQDATATAQALLQVISPQDLLNVQTAAMVYMSAGDLAGARAVLRSALQQGAPAPRLAAQMTGYFEVGWALEEAEQQLTLRLTPAAFDNDRSWWAQSLATLHWQRGDTARARAFADSALVPTRVQIAGAPGDVQLHGLLALQLAYLGRVAEARKEAAVALNQSSSPSNLTYHLLNAARAEVALGDKAAAVQHLHQARRLGYFVTNGWLSLDPTFASLKGFPAYEQMLKEGK